MLKDISLNETLYLSRVLNGSLVSDGKEVLGNFQIKGCVNDEERAKHAAAKRWVYAVSNWGEPWTVVFSRLQRPAVAW